MADINGDRLWDQIISTAKWGEMPDRPGGMMRLALTDDDQMVRDWFCKEARAIGCEVRVDEMGSIFAILPGENRSIPPIGIGSHLDTQPAGGRFDGILGVLAGLEILRWVKESGHRLYADLAVIDWTNEEGARFSPGCTGAAVWACHTSVAAAHIRPSNCGSTTLGAELNRIHYLGSTKADHRENPLSAHFELHIEQGSQLENAGQAIGIVNAIQGIHWFQVRVLGERAHSGATPMANRADALTAACKIVLLIEEISKKHDAVGTVGTMAIENASPNVISGDVSFSIDMRHPSEVVLAEMDASIRKEMAAIEERMEGRIQFKMTRTWHSPAQDFNAIVIECIQQAAIEVCGNKKLLRTMRSRAGHDSALVALSGTPTAMLFVPSRNGISHAPEEWTDKNDCVTGIKTLRRSVLLYDDYLRRQHSKQDNSSIRHDSPLRNDHVAML